MIAAGYIEALVKSGLTVGVADPGRIFMSIRQVPYGVVLCRQGDLADRLWIVVRGRLVPQSPEIVRKAPSYEPYALVGERGVLGRMVQRVADLVSQDEHTEVLEILATDIEKHPQNYLLYRNIAAINSDRVLAAYKEYEVLATDRAELLETAKRFVGTDFFNRKKLIPDDYRDCAREDAVIWFSDVAGFSSRCAGVEPARVAPFIREALSRQIIEVQGASGYVDKLMGDGIMAYWPSRFHDDGVSACDRACKAALAALASVAQMQFDAQPVSIRIGLNFGTVFIGEFGTPERAQYTLIGHEVNKASRLENARDDAVKDPPGAKLGALRVSESFHGRLPAQAKESLPQLVTLSLKGVGDVVAYTSPPV